MPHNDSAVNSPFWDRQMEQLSYIGMLHLLPLEQLGKSKVMCSHCVLLTQFCRNWSEKLNRWVLHITVRQRTENADVYISDLIAWQQSNQMEGEPFASVQSKCPLIDCVRTWCHSTQINQCKHTFILQLNWNTNLWCQNMVSVFGFGCPVEVMQLTSVNIP
jgi:hypothetical protein